MPDDAFKRLEPEFLALARRIWDAGVKAERARLRAILETVESDESAGQEAKRSSQTTGYGSVSAPVREALIQLAAESLEGVGARDIAQHFERLGSGPNERQVRAALKTLSITGEARRASRGRYLPRAAASPSAGEENPDARASGHFSLAAD